MKIFCVTVSYKDVVNIPFVGTSIDDVKNRVQHLFDNNKLEFSNHKRFKSFDINEIKTLVESDELGISYVFPYGFGDTDGNMTVKDYIEEQIKENAVEENKSLKEKVSELQEEVKDLKKRLQHAWANN